MTGKSLTESQLIGRQGEAAVVSLLTCLEFVCIPTGAADFGEDIICDIFQDGVRTNLSFRVQVKTSKGFGSTSQIRAGKDGLSLQVSTALLEAWSSANYPVILVCWDIASNKGYWCSPVDLKDDRKKTNSKNTTIQVDYSQEFNINSRHEIISCVEKFFSTHLKIKSKMYECSIYPVIMPDYRLVLSTPKLPDFIDRNLIETEQSEYIPSFLGSYTSLTLSPFTNKIKFSHESKSLDFFIDELKKFILLISNNFTISSNNWISYIISPVHISSGDIYLRNNDFYMTEWISYSFLYKEIFSDWDFTFKLSTNFIPTYKERSLSVDEDYFISINGNFAVEIQAFTKSNSIYSNSIKTQKNIARKCFILWDINGVSEKDFFKLEEWGIKNGLIIQKINSDDSIDAIIRDPMFNQGPYGTLTPSPMTWDQYDNSDISKLIPTIPYGKVMDETRTKKYLSMFETSADFDDIAFINYDSKMHGLSLIHNLRTIIFSVCFEPIVNEESSFFVQQIDLLIKKLKTMSERVEFYTTRGVPDEFLHVAVECRPYIKYTSKKFCDIFYHDINNFSDAINLHFNGRTKTFKYIRYHCGRYFDVEELST